MRFQAGGKPRSVLGTAEIVTGDVQLAYPTLT